MYNKYFVKFHCEITLTLISFKYCVVVCQCLLCASYSKISHNLKYLHCSCSCKSIILYYTEVWFVFNVVCILRNNSKSILV